MPVMLRRFWFSFCLAVSVRVGHACRACVCVSDMLYSHFSRHCATLVPSNVDGEAVFRRKLQKALVGRGSADDLDSMRRVLAMHHIASTSAAGAAGESVDDRSAFEKHNVPSPYSSAYTCLLYTSPSPRDS